MVSFFRSFLKTYKDVFLGTEFVDWLIEIGLANERHEAVEYGRRLLNGLIIEHAHKEHHFCDLPYFYQFVNSNIEVSSDHNDSD